MKLNRRWSDISRRRSPLHFALLVACATAFAAPAAIAAESASGARLVDTGMRADTAGELVKTSYSVKSSNKKKRVVKKRVKGQSKKALKSRKKTVRRVIIPATPSLGHTMGLHKASDALRLQSSVALVLDQNTNEVLYSKNADAVLPIASLTKLMTALVVVDAKQPMDEMLTISNEDIDREKHSTSRLRLGATLSRQDMLLLALMSSENRAASALSRHYPGGQPAFIAAMNRKAKALGMTDTHYDDPTGLTSTNVSSAVDLSRIVKAAYQYPLIREYSTKTEYQVTINRRRLQYHSSNRLISTKNDWDIGLQKTGYTAEAGRCLVMQAMVKERAVVMVFLDSVGQLSRFADANRVRNWLEHSHPQAVKVSNSVSIAN